MKPSPSKKNLNFYSNFCQFWILEKPSFYYIHSKSNNTCTKNINSKFAECIGQLFDIEREREKERKREWRRRVSMSVWVETLWPPIIRVTDTPTPTPMPTSTTSTTTTSYDRATDHWSLITDLEQVIDPKSAYVRAIWYWKRKRERENGEEEWVWVYEWKRYDHL